MYDLKNELLEACKNLVNQRVQEAKLPFDQEEELRQSLTEDIRFWKGW